MKTTRRHFIKFSGYVISVGLAFNLFFIFLMAYLNDFAIGIYINHYGEAHIELILFPLTLIFCLVGLWFAWKDLNKQKKKDKVK